MKSFLRSVSIAAAAGIAGALVNSAAVWAAGHYGLTARAHVRLAPGFTPGWLYPRIAWGALWGLLLLVPLLERRPFWRAVVLSLAPTAAQLLWFFPRTPAGYLGLSLGALTPVFVFLFNLLWALVAVGWYRAA
ncbi:MAG TPA: hypothetical protein VFS40_15485 [Gemmatimonadales bacterium]|nr:hypothetical protein [Gemmatimonadales bacterium]